MRVITILSVLFLLCVGQEVRAQNYILQDSRSEMTNFTNLIYSLSSSNRLRGQHKSTKPNLVVRCKENNIDVMVETGSLFSPAYGEFGKTPIRVRVDDGKAIWEYWREATNQRAAFAPKPLSLTKKITDARTLRLEITPFSSSPQVIEFDISQSKEAFQKIAERCNRHIYTKSNLPEKSTTRRSLSYEESKQVGEEIGRKISENQYIGNVDLLEGCTSTLDSLNLYTEHDIIFVAKCAQTYRIYRGYKDYGGEN